jgi:hypothetical protein
METRGATDVQAALPCKRACNHFWPHGPPLTLASIFSLDRVSPSWLPDFFFLRPCETAVDIQRPL